MRWIGLTGGIGTGKTEAASLLRERGFAVIDADELSRRALSPGSAGLSLVVERFGSDLLKEGGELNREALAAQVFHNPSALATLESIVHPFVKKFSQEERLRFEHLGKKTVFYDVPLLFEKGMENEFDTIICVYASPELQLQRLVEKRGYSEQDAQARIKNQLPIQSKSVRSSHVIINEGSLAELQFEIQKMIEELRLTP